jgi:hypothetical protein
MGELKKPGASKLIEGAFSAVWGWVVTGLVTRIVRAHPRCTRDEGSCAFGCVAADAFEQVAVRVAGE